MPVLQDQEDVKRFILPSTEDKPADQQAWVQMDVSPLVGNDYVDVARGASNASVMAAVTAIRIKQWNLSEANGVVIEISAANLLRIPFSDLVFLNDQIGEEEGLPEPLNKDEKKDSTSGTPQSGSASQ